MEIAHNGYVSSNKTEIADMFSSVYSTNNINTTNDLPNISKFDLPNNVYFSLDDNCNGLSALKGNWSVGPDGICGEFLYQIVLLSNNNFYVTSTQILTYKCGNH